jgi:hypothetical protein
MESHRYNLHKNLNIYWTNFDGTTGQKAVVNGFVRDMLTADEGDELVGMLNRIDEEEQRRFTRRRQLDIQSPNTFFNTTGAEHDLAPWEI